MFQRVLGAFCWTKVIAATANCADLSGGSRLDGNANRIDPGSPLAYPLRVVANPAEARVRFRTSNGLRAEGIKMRSMIRPCMFLGLAGMGFSVTPAMAASVCDAVPASAVIGALGLPGQLIPNVAGSGCDYNMGEGAKVSVSVHMDADADGIKTMFDAGLKSHDSSYTKIAGVGDAATLRSEKMNNFILESLVFRAKGKIVSLDIASYVGLLPNSAIVKLGALFASKI